MHTKFHDHRSSGFGDIRADPQTNLRIYYIDCDFSLIESQETTTTSESQNSPKNLKKVMAAMRSNINNNVARVNRPREEGLVNNNQQPSPPLSASSKKR